MTPKTQWYCTAGEGGTTGWYVRDRRGAEGDGETRTTKGGRVSDEIADARLEEIRGRLSSVAGPAWKYNPKHEMFMGTTNALEMYHQAKQ